MDIDVALDSSPTVFMDEEDIPVVIGKGGKTIDMREKSWTSP